MNNPLSELYAVRPICSLCCCAFNPQLSCMQMDCYHIFCQYCLPEMAMGQIYMCPFDGTQGLVYAYSMDYITTTEGILANPVAYSSGNTQQYICQVVTTLRNSINFQFVPCRYFTRHRNCDAAYRNLCPYDHGNYPIITHKTCPIGNNCHRSEFCPYMHPAPIPQHNGPSQMYPGPNPMGPMPGQILQTMNPGPVSPFQYHKLPGWYHMQPALGSTLIQLPPTDKGYRDVAAHFNQTSGMKTIVKIERIQNRRLYTPFAFKHEGISQMEGRPLKILRLFHGTRRFDPKLIYDSDTGLDSRVCTHGGWGLGTYFAQNSYYSVDRYGHKLPDGTQQIFCLLVIVGDSYDYGTKLDKVLTRPPVKQGTQQFYHSVKGSEGGSDIYVVYEPHMSYPYYLVTFR